MYSPILLLNHIALAPRSMNMDCANSERYRKSLSGMGDWYSLINISSRLGKIFSTFHGNVGEDTSHFYLCITAALPPPYSYHTTLRTPIPLPHYRVIRLSIFPLVASGGARRWGIWHVSLSRDVWTMTVGVRVVNKWIRVKWLGDAWVERNLAQ